MPTTVEATTEMTTKEQSTTQRAEVTTTERGTRQVTEIRSTDMTPINGLTTSSEMVSLKAINLTTSPPVPVVDFPGPDTFVPVEGGCTHF